MKPPLREGIVLLLVTLLLSQTFSRTFSAELLAPGAAFFHATAHSCRKFLRPIQKPQNGQNDVSCRDVLQARRRSRSIAAILQAWLAREALTYQSGSGRIADRPKCNGISRPKNRHKWNIAGGSYMSGPRIYSYDAIGITNCVDEAI
jgi:hypothetical protein|nr:hypothetical protein [Acidiferrobacter sp. SPIII_3]